mmetsp:Transcript_46126/g.111765  ORF Transcript_46126/g.111765 Transcript_46126/m.111765 type:complete len:383 (+) Transcript_46126:1130-2278(+)
MVPHHHPLIPFSPSILPFLSWNAYRIQGLLNSLIYCRPKYLMLRLEFPSEGRLWTVKRIFLGDKLRPTSGANMDIVVKGECEPDSNGDSPVGNMETCNKTVASRLPRHMISSVTASEGDFDDSVAETEVGGGDGRWHDAGGQVKQGSPGDLASGLNRLTTLDSISEMSESVFDLTPYQANGSHHSAAFVIPTDPPERRWKGTEITSTPETTHVASSLDSNGNDLDGVQGRPSRTDSRMEVPRSKPNSSDLPMQVPRRISSETDSSSLDSNGHDLGDLQGSPSRTDTRMEVPRRKSESSDLPMQVPRRTSSETDSPSIPVPKRLSDDSPTQSCSRSSDSSPVRNSKRLTSQQMGQIRSKQAFDMPLARPERLVSLPPSEIEDV